MLRYTLLLAFALAACAVQVPDNSSPPTYGSSAPNTSDGSAPPYEETLPEGCQYQHLDDGRTIIMCVNVMIKGWETIPDPLSPVEQGHPK